MVINAAEETKRKITGQLHFVVVTELTGGPGFDFGYIEKFLKVYKAAGNSVIPSEFDFGGITFPQNRGGVANIELADMLSQIKLNDLLGELIYDL